MSLGHLFESCERERKERERIRTDERKGEPEDPKGEGKHGFPTGDIFSRENKKEGPVAI